MKMRSRFVIGEVFVIAPEPLEVGLRKARLLKNRVVVRGTVEAGEFTAGDSVHMGSERGRTEAVLLDVIPCDTAENFNVALKANLHDSVAVEGSNAWLILDVGDEPRPGEVIVK